MTKKSTEAKPAEPIESAYERMLTEDAPAPEEQEPAAPAVEIPALPFMANAHFVLTKVEQVQSLHELGADVLSEQAPADRTLIHAFKAMDGRTLHVVMIDGNLFSQARA